MKDALKVVRTGLNQLTVIALQHAKKDIADHPELILMNGRVFDINMDCIKY